ncbi:MAG: Arc family DNA-binding protein [Gemmatimonadetes bacterium]|nr:Arc family DNA-binding protein [Gemmatimonadota bacterium]
MPSITIKGVPEEVYVRVRRRAERNRRSLNAELIVALEEAVGLRNADQAEVWRDLDALVDSLPPVDHARSAGFIAEGRH